jgi:2,3-bisphosphoglycerate-dependent phosphoglycerate mutase
MSFSRINHSTSLQVPIVIHNESEQAKAWSQVFSEDTKKQSIPVIAAWQLNERM